MIEAPPTVRPDRGDTPPVGVATSIPYLPELESLRGIAALMVLTFHYDAAVLRVLSPGAGEWCSLPAAFVRAGHSGVNLFFVLSAFLLSLPFLATAAGGPRVSWWRYAKRRALRILPLYYCVVAVGTLATATGMADLSRAVPYLLFLNGFGIGTPMPPYGNVWWSLATEMQFYVALPLMALMFERPRARVVGFLLLGAYAVAWVLFERGTIVPATTVAGAMAVGLSLFGHGPVFLSGVAAAALYRRHGADWRRRAAERPWLRRGGADAVLAGLLLVIATYLRWLVFIGARRFHAPPGHAWQALAGPLWGAVVLVVLVAPLRLKGLLHNRWLTRVGVLSYSIYVLHLPVLTAVRRALGLLGTPRLGAGAHAALVLALSSIACVGLAAVTYRWVEAPFLRRKEALRG